MGEDMILVTGCHGLIGSHLCKELRKRKRKFKGIDIEECDLTHQKDVYVKLPLAKVIIHTADITHIPTIKSSPFEAIFNNVLSIINLLKYASSIRVKQFIYLSSCSIYGDTSSSYLDVDENFPYNPKGIYGATKACGEILAIACYKQLELPVTILRLSSVYGAGDKHSRVVPNFIDRALSGKPLMVESNVKKEFTYAGDVVNAIISCINNKKAIGEIFNIHGGDVVSILELAKYIKGNISNTEIVYNFKKDREQTDRGNISIKKAKKILKYKPKISLEQGIGRILNAGKVSQNR